MRTRVTFAVSASAAERTASGGTKPSADAAPPVLRNVRRSMARSGRIMSRSRTFALESGHSMATPRSTAPPPLVECRDVTVYRGEVRALDRLTLTIAAGEHVAILGPNGCGKSTFIKTLTCECYPACDSIPFTLRIMGR